MIEREIEDSNSEKGERKERERREGGRKGRLAEAPAVAARGPWRPSESH